MRLIFWRFVNTSQAEQYEGMIPDLKAHSLTKRTEELKRQFHQAQCHVAGTGCRPVRIIHFLKGGIPQLKPSMFQVTKWGPVVLSLNLISLWHIHQYLLQLQEVRQYMGRKAFATKSQNWISYKKYQNYREILPISYCSTVKVIPNPYPKI